MNWIKSKEQLPENHGLYLCIWDSNVYLYVYTDDKIWINDEGYEVYQPNLWSNIELPTEGEQ